MIDKNVVVNIAILKTEVTHLEEQIKEKKAVLDYYMDQLGTDMKGENSKSYKDEYIHVYPAEQPTQVDHEMVRNSGCLSAQALGTIVFRHLQLTNAQWKKVFEALKKRKGNTITTTPEEFIKTFLKPDPAKEPTLRMKLLKEFTINMEE